MDRYSERIALFGLGAATVLLVQAIPKLRRAYLKRHGGWRSIKPYVQEKLTVRHLNKDDKDVEEAKAFIMDGYIGVKRAEGDITVPNSKLSRVRAGLENVLSSGRGKDGPSGVLLCMDERQAFCGYLWYGQYDFNPIGPTCYLRPTDAYLWVHTIYTKPEARRQGVAATLQAELRQIAFQKQISTIKLDVYTANVGSIRFHEALGFNLVAGFYEKAALVG